MPTTSKATTTKKKMGPPAGKWTTCAHCLKRLQVANAVGFQGKRYHAVCFDPALKAMVRKVSELFSTAVGAKL